MSGDPWSQQAEQRLTDAQQRLKDAQRAGDGEAAELAFEDLQAARLVLGRP